MSARRTCLQSGTLLEGWLRPLGQLLLDLVAPRQCAACSEPATTPAWCAACADAFAGVPKVARAHLDGTPLVAAGRYGGPLLVAIRRLKYEGRPELAAPLAGLVPALPAAAEGGSVPLVVPVPLHPARLVDRGYNQSALLARHLARRLRARFSPTALVRRRVTSPQAQAARDAREQNVAGAFRTGSCPLAASRVILVDDVVTSGATLRECLRALREAGASVQSIAVLADAGVSATASSGDSPPKPLARRL